MPLLSPPPPDVLGKKDWYGNIRGEIVSKTSGPPFYDIKQHIPGTNAWVKLQKERLSKLTAPIGPQDEVTFDKALQVVLDWGPMGMGQIKGFRGTKKPDIKHAYESIRSNNATKNVYGSYINIADLRDHLRITQSEMERIIKSDPEHFLTSKGDWSFSDEHIRSGAVHLGYGSGSPELLVKVKEGAVITPPKQRKELLSQWKKEYGTKEP
uniref:Uncharacterized protein n=1 Tax=viral metagenome TaxID=1070528 RepID=A0A6M3K756_9ZZZZ